MNNTINSDMLLNDDTTCCELLKLLNKIPAMSAASACEAEVKEDEALDAQLHDAYGEDYEDLIKSTTRRKKPKKARRRPGANQLRDNEALIGQKKIGDEGVIEAYGNGYAIYDNGDRKTVVWIPDCTTYTYHFNPLNDAELRTGQRDKAALETEGDEGLMSMQWYIPGALKGEDQIDRNMAHPKSKGVTSDFTQEEPDVEGGLMGLSNVRFENPEDALIRKEEIEEMKKLLTDKQREVFELYYEQGYTQRETRG